MEYWGNAATKLASKFLSIPLEETLRGEDGKSDSGTDKTINGIHHQGNKLLFRVDDRVNISVMLASSSASIFSPSPISPTSSSEPSISISSRLYSDPRLEAIHRLVINHANPRPWIKFNQDHFVQIMKITGSFSASKAATKITPKGPKEGIQYGKPTITAIQTTELSLANRSLLEAVYAYLVRYAEKEPELTLMSLNSLHKSLNDRNTLSKVAALLAISNTRLADLTEFTFLAIRKCMQDLSINVRKISAISCIRLASFPDYDQLKPVLQKLLTDDSIIVKGAAIVALHYLIPCSSLPEYFDPENFNRICDLLLDADEWCLPLMLHVLTNFVRQSCTIESKEKGANELLQKYLLVLGNLLYHRSSAVVLSAALLIESIKPEDDDNQVMQLKVNKALLWLFLREGQEMKSIIISIISVMQQGQSIKKSEFWKRNIRKFFIRNTDKIYLQVKKIQFLASFCRSSLGSGGEPSAFFKDIFQELGQYCKSSSKTVAGLAITAVGEFAVQFPGYSEKVIEKFVHIIRSNQRDIVVRYAVLVVKRLFPRLPSKLARRSTLIKLFKDVSHTDVSLSTTVATIYWLITMHLHELEPMLCLDFLRIAAKEFQESSVQVKLQVLFLCARIQALHFDNHPIISYIYDIADVDPHSYEVRDLARSLKSQFHEYMKNISYHHHAAAAATTTTSNQYSEVSGKVESGMQTKFILGTASWFLQFDFNGQCFTVSPWSDSTADTLKLASSQVFPPPNTDGDQVKSIPDTITTTTTKSKKEDPDDLEAFLASSSSPTIEKEEPFLHHQQNNGNQVQNSNNSSNDAANGEKNGLACVVVDTTHFHLDNPFA